MNSTRRAILFQIPAALAIGELSSLFAQRAPDYDFSKSDRKWNEHNLENMLNGEMKEKALEAAGDFFGRVDGLNIEVSWPADYYRAELSRLERANINTTPTPNTEEETKYDRNAFFIPKARFTFYDPRTNTGHVNPVQPGDEQKKVTYRELWYNGVLRDAIIHTAIKRFGGVNYSKRIDDLNVKSYGTDIFRTEAPSIEQPSDVLTPDARGITPPSQGAQVVGAFFNGLAYLIAGDIAKRNGEAGLLYESQYASSIRDAAKQIPGLPDPVSSNIAMAQDIRNFSGRYKGSPAHTVEQRFSHVAEEFINYILKDNPETHVLGREYLKRVHPTRVR